LCARAAGGGGWGILVRFAVEGGGIFFLFRILSYPRAPHPATYSLSLFWQECCPSAVKKLHNNRCVTPLPGLQHDPVPLPPKSHSCLVALSFPPPPGIFRQTFDGSFRPQSVATFSFAVLTLTIIDLIFLLS